MLFFWIRQVAAVSHPAVMPVRVQGTEFNFGILLPEKAVKYSCSSSTLLFHSSKGARRHSKTRMELLLSDLFSQRLIHNMYQM